MAVVRYPGTLRDAPAVRSLLIGVQPDRYPAVGFWRGDFADRPLGATMAALADSPVPPVDLGRADQLEVAVGAGAVRSDGPVHLVALVQGPSHAARVDLGRLEPGLTSAVSLALTFDSIRAGQGGGWRLVDGFDDPARWYSLNDNAYEPGDTLSATTGVDGPALAVAIDAPSSGVTLGIGHASVPEALPAVVTPAFLRAVSAQVGRVVRVRGPIPGDLLIKVVGVASVLPGAVGANVAAFVDGDWLLVHAQRNPIDRPAADEVWTVGGDRGRRVAERLGAGGVRVESRSVAADQEAVLAQQAPSLALLLLLVGAAAGAALATGGVMLHLYLTGRRRAFELAVLEVFGAGRRDLWGPVAVEQGSLVGYGVLCGGLIGLLVALVALPAIPQFVDRPSVPPPIYTPDWGTLGLALGLAVLLVGLGLAVVVAALVHQARPALLREEEL
jgi:hypothetical protein